MICVSSAYLKTVKDILQKYVPDTEVRVFGSRVTGKAKDWSDLDLVVVGKQRIDSYTLASLCEAFEESDIPFRVDVLDWYNTSERFRSIIEKQYEVIQAAPDVLNAKP